MEKREIVSGDNLSIYLEDELMKVHILQFGISTKIKPENVFVDITMKKETAFSPIFLLETEGREQFIGITFDDLSILDMNKMGNLADDVKKAHNGLKEVIKFMDERFPGMIKKETY